MKQFAYDESFDDVRLLEDELSKLKASGWSIFEFPAEIGGKKEIFDYAKRTFPLDPPIGLGSSWDALSDSIGGGIEKLRGGGVVIVVKYNSRHKSSSAAAMELIDILFGIKEFQFLNSMRMYCYRPKD